MPVRAVAAPRPDPLARVLSIGVDMTGVIILCVVGAIIVHGAAGVRTLLIDPWLLRWASRTGMQIESRLQASIDVTTEKETPPPPPVDEPKEEDQPKEVVTTKPVEQNPYDKVESKPNNPTPDSAQAGDVLHDDTVDFTGDGFVTGSATTYAGGKTTRDGKKKKEERIGGPGGGGTGQDPPPKPPVDLSRGITLAGSKEWSCPTWPAEADAQQVDEWHVTIEVTVGPDGRAQNVVIVKDGDYGFGAAARTCAMKQSYNAALDRDGKPMIAKKQWRVLFER
jgi:hypothetical protein